MPSQGQGYVWKSKEYSNVKDYPTDYKQIIHSQEHKIAEQNEERIMNILLIIHLQLPTKYQSAHKHQAQ